MQKGFSVILIEILVLVIVAAGVYYIGKSKLANPSRTPQSTIAPKPTFASKYIAPMITKNDENFTPELQKQIVPLDETASWKTYTNQKDGVSFKYPGDWRLTVKGNTSTDYDEITVAKIVQVPLPDQDNKTTESIAEEFYIYPVKNNGKPQFTGLQMDKQITVNDIKCSGQENEGGQNAPHKYYECITSQTNFGISLISVQKNYDTLSQILSTFKFIQ